MVFQLQYYDCLFALNNTITVSQLFPVLLLFDFRVKKNDTVCPTMAVHIIFKNVRVSLLFVYKI